MKQTLMLFLLCGAWLMAAGQKAHHISFDSKYEVAGQKLALKDINPNLPRNWDGFNYVVLEYKISTTQRFHVGFTTEGGYNELRLISYVPGAWNRLAIPLRFFTHEPGSAVDLASTYNQPRHTGWINLGGRRTPLHGVDSIGFRMSMPIGNPSLEIRHIYLSREDPGDLYMDDRPAFDEFGQSNLLEFPHKVHSLDELKRDWAQEEADLSDASAFNYSRYGGYKQKRLKATGFFRTERWKDRWWLVDPDGYLFLSVGVDCIHAEPGENIRDVNRRAGMFRELPPTELMRQLGNVDWRSGAVGYNFSLWNLYRRYGDDYRAKALDMTFRRMDRWGINTVANWSAHEVQMAGRKAFLFPLNGLGLSSDLMGLADVYDPEFQKQLEESIARQAAPLRDNPWLIGYFLGNEPAWLHREVSLARQILSGRERPIRSVLQDYVARHGDGDEALRTFIVDTFEKFLQQTNAVLKKHDPNHLNLGIRFGDTYGLSDRILRMCGKYFDVYSFNCYDQAPSHKSLDRLQQLVGLPAIIGEFHFGSVERGYGQSLWQTDSQTDRAQAYRYYVEQAYAHPSLVGTGYFQWSDQPIVGRFDGENYNCGLIDATDRPYPEQTAAMAETAKRLFDIHRGTLAPFHQPVSRILGHGGIKNQWNK